MSPYLVYLVDTEHALSRNWVKPAASLHLHKNLTGQPVASSSVKRLTDRERDNNVYDGPWHIGILVVLSAESTTMSSKPAIVSEVTIFLKEIKATKR